MKNSLHLLKAILAEIADLSKAAAVLSWDQQVNMPPAGAEARGNQLALLGRLAHERATSPELGKLLEQLQKEIEALDPASDEARLIKVTARDYEKATRVPPEFVAEMTQVTTQAFQAWVEARQQANFAHFRPYLEKILELTHQYIGFFPPADHPYDVLLDNYEPGMKTAEVKAIFESLRPRQVALIREISQQPQVDDSFLHQPFNEQKQWDFGVEVLTKIGYDWQRGRQDKSPHPFTTSFSINDVRITTRLDPSFLNPMLFGSIHECGHALYEMGVHPSYERTSLEGGASLAIHESQSRLWENLVGRSLAFWEHFYPRLQEYFPHLANIPLEKFYQGINKVAPSPIRVEADEATYNLHIMLRLEIEIALVSGQLAVKDLPEVWNAKMQEYLGIAPKNDAEGVLQDVHWSNGYIGYFATYALGNLVSAQLWEKIRQDIPNLEGQIRAGDFKALLHWLRENIHQYGRKYEPQELIQRVTGSKITPEPYLRYLTGKFSDIYGL